LELYLGSTQFTSGSFPSTIWDSYAGLSFVGQNFIEIGNAEYTGNPAQTPPVRWGDYNTMLYDPDAIPPGGEGSWWSVEEISKGGSDESTNWEALADPTPLPYFVNWDPNEKDCAGGGSTCKITAGPPYGVQAGDLILVALVLGEPANSNPHLPDSSWTLLPASNVTGNPTMIASGGCNGLARRRGSPRTYTRPVTPVHIPFLTGSTPSVPSWRLWP
jgi:hypothetical protein